jgi:hypothetical protein
METISDMLREEAKDYQQLSAAQYKRVWRGYYKMTPEWTAREQAIMARQAYYARSALFELIGAEPE